MRLHIKVAERIELEDGIFGEDGISEGLRIEEILRRAHEIHRARGGLIGYDLEDWLQAEREWIGDISLHPVSGSKSTELGTSLVGISVLLVSTDWKQEGPHEATHSVPDRTGIQP